jgi:hypothetical protein
MANREIVSTSESGTKSPAFSRKDAAAGETLKSMPDMGMTDGPLMHALESLKCLVASGDSPQLEAAVTKLTQVRLPGCYLPRFMCKYSTLSLPCASPS